MLHKRGSHPIPPTGATLKSSNTFLSKRVTKSRRSMTGWPNLSSALLRTSVFEESTSIRWDRLTVANDAADLLQQTEALNSAGIEFIVGSHKPWKSRGWELWLMVPSKNYPQAIACIGALPQQSNLHPPGRMILHAYLFLHLETPMPFGTAKECIGKWPTRRQLCKSGKVRRGSVPARSDQPHA